MAGKVNLANFQKEQAVNRIVSESGLKTAKAAWEQ